MADVVGQKPATTPRSKIEHSGGGNVMGEATLSNNSEIGLSSLLHRPECSLNVMVSIPIEAPLADGQGFVEMRVNAPLGGVRANALLRSIGVGGPDRRRPPSKGGSHIRSPASGW